MRNEICTGASIREAESQRKSKYMLEVIVDERCTKGRMLDHTIDAV